MGSTTRAVTIWATADSYWPVALIASCARCEAVPPEAAGQLQNEQQNEDPDVHTSTCNKLPKYTQCSAYVSHASLQRNAQQEMDGAVIVVLAMIQHDCMSETIAHGVCCRR